MSYFTRDVITNYRKLIKDLTDNLVSETLRADEFAELLDDALDEIELLNARIAELLDEINSLKKYKAESESVIGKAKDLLGDEMGEWLPVDPVYLPERLQQLRQVLYILEGLEKGA